MTPLSLLAYSQPSPRLRLLWVLLLMTASAQLMVGGSLTVLPVTVSNGAVGQDDSVTFFATGGDAPLLDFAPWRAPGVQWLIAEGALQGKPNAVGTY